MEGTETTVETLKNGECLLVDARIVKNGKISLQFAEIIRPENEQMSLVAYSNRYDDSFSTKARRSWLITDPQAATEDYGVDFTDTGDWYEGPKGTMLDLNILNPIFNELNFRVRIVESTKPTESQQKYADELEVDVIETQAKRAGKGGDYILHQGQHIFMNSYVDLLPEGDNPQHAFLESDTSNSSVEANTGVKVDEVEVMM